MKFKKLMAAVTTGVLAVTSLSLSGLIGSAEVQELMNDTFESGYGAWKGVGSSLSLSTEQAHNGGTSLYCYDRTANWGAPRCSLTGIVAAGQSYEISASAMYEGSGQQNMAIKMIYTDANGTDHYDQVAATQATAGQWVEIKGNYTVPSGATDMILYVEMPTRPIILTTSSLKAKRQRSSWTTSSNPTSTTTPPRSGTAAAVPR